MSCSILARRSCRQYLARLCSRSTSQFARRRTYEDVSVESVPESKEFAVTLDGKRLKTPLGNDVILPSGMAANAMAREWSIQEEVIKPHIMPLTQLINLAIDQPTNRPAEQIAADILAYLETDTLRCRAGDESPEELVKLQTEKWDPLIKWIEQRFAVEVPCSAGLFVAAPAAQTVSTLQDYIVNLNSWSRTSLESATSSCKSFVTATALLEGLVNVDEAMDVSQLENLFQIERWGNVEWAHPRDFAALKSSLAAAYLVNAWCGQGVGAVR